MRKISELIDDFHLTQKLEGRAVKYIDLCERRLSNWCEYTRSVLSIENIEDVKASHIRSYIGYCQELGREKAITINGNLSTIRVFFKYLIDEEFIDELDDPTRRVKDLREDKRIITTFNDEEVRRILQYAPEATYSNIRDKCIIAFLFDTGIRVSELCGIKNDDIRVDSILIRGKVRRSVSFTLVKPCGNICGSMRRQRRKNSISRILMKSKIITSSINPVGRCTERQLIGF